MINNSTNQIIGDIIKSNIKESGYSNDQISTLSGIPLVVLSNLIKGKVNVTSKISKNLAKVFSNWKNDPNFLFDTYNKINNLDDTDAEILPIAKSVKSLELHDKYSQIQIIKNNLCGLSYKNFEDKILKSSILFSKYKNDQTPESKLWVILMYKKYKHIKNNNNFKIQIKEKIYNKILKIFFKNNSFQKRNDEITNLLFKHSIVLKNGPFFADSKLKGIALKPGNTRYIFLTDMFKREYRWIISLIHEIAHFYENITDEKEIEDFAINKIKMFINDNNIDNHKILHDFNIFFSLYSKNSFIIQNKEDYFKKLRDNTHQKINFGQPERLMDLIFE